MLLVEYLILVHLGCYQNFENWLERLMVTKRQLIDLTTKLVFSKKLPPFIAYGNCYSHVSLFKVFEKSDHVIIIDQKKIIIGAFL